jgi:hypothetical protein
MPDTESWLEERHMVSTWLRVFGRLKPGLRIMQAMAAGIAAHVCNLEELING